MAWYPCPNCCNKVCPHEWCNAPNVCCMKVVLAGITDGTCSAGNCLNGTYYLAWDGEGHIFGARWGSGWVRDLSRLEFCNVSGLHASFDEDDAQDVFLRIELRVSDQEPHVWRHTFGPDKPPCVQTDLDVPHIETGGGGFVTAGSTCTVTTLPSPNVGSPQDCPPAPLPQGCNACACKKTPEELFVAVSGVVTPPAPCFDPNNTYVLRHVDSPPYCGWKYESGPHGCTGSPNRKCHQLDWEVTAGLLVGDWGAGPRVLPHVDLSPYFPLAALPTATRYHNGFYPEIEDYPDWPLDCHSLEISLPYRRHWGIRCSSEWDFSGASVTLSSGPP